jgi:hypothetical protein
MGYTQPGGMHKGSDILSSRNQFSYLFSCDILLGGADQKRRAWNQSTNLVLLLISYTNRQRLAEGISRSFPSLCLSIQRIHRIIFFLLFNGRRCSADDYIGAREKKRSNAVKEEEEEKFLIKNPSILM